MFHCTHAGFSSLQHLRTTLHTLLAIALCALPVAVEAADNNFQSLYNFQSKMAAQGSVEAMIKLGEMHEEGMGTEKSDEQARQWYQKARDKGHPEAQQHLDNLVRRQERAVREKAAREQADKERRAREQAERERLVHEQAERERVAQQAASSKHEAAKKVLTAAEKTRAREEAIRRADEAERRSLEKQLEKERAESEALRHARDGAAKKR